MPALARIAWQLGTGRYRILEIPCREYLPELIEIADQDRSVHQGSEMRVRAARQGDRLDERRRDAGAGLYRHG
jgi:hypothetical protein